MSKHDPPSYAATTRGPHSGHTNAVTKAANLRAKDEYYANVHSINSSECRTYYNPSNFTTKYLIAILNQNMTPTILAVAWLVSIN
ncbi:hypothetical protein N7470_002113 [Penicillium chermesinum]|nr:hypothetical protein N7470_002113 [Penicillium chermesinum]